jgi:Ca-activated chloride channel family protein
MKNLNFYTIFLCLVLIFLSFYYSFRKWEDRKKIIDLTNKYPNLLFQMKLIPKWALIWKIIIYPVLGILFSIALLNPHLREENLGGENVLTGVDVVFIVDVSLSMNSTDTFPNRLSRFKDVVLSILPELTGNRLGIITFAGTPFLYCPMTSDLSAFSDYLRGLDTDMIPDTGTNLAKAIDKANELLKSRRVLKNKILVLVTDGEDKAHPKARLEGSELVIWGVGTKQGGPIFYQDEAGRILGYVSKDRRLYSKPDSPDVIISHLEESYLRNLASKNNAEYYNIAIDPDAPKKLVEKISNLEKNSNKVLKEISKKDGYQFFIAPAFLLLLLDVCLIEWLVLKKMKTNAL